MTLDELVKRDSSFNSSTFISKVNNMVKKLYNATTLNELETVDHLVSDKVLKSFQDEIDKANSINEKVIFDQVNVNSEIRDISVIDDFYMIRCTVTVQYFKYYIDNNGNYTQGNQSTKTRVIRNAILKKPVGSSLGIVNRCLGCGTTLNINDNGKCPSCGRIFDLEEFDFYIEDFV